MRIAFVSDIHGNLPAWKAVHSDILAQDVDKIICLGDIVGYGPSPAEVLTEVYGCVHHFVLGNHDAVVAGVLEPTGFNEYARELIELTQNSLGEKAVEFFNNVPLSLRNSTFRCAHGNPAAPAKYSYVFDEDDARIAWEQTEHPLMFVGHTHRPALHELTETDEYHQRKSRQIPTPLAPEGRYIINCGSVGMPRDDDFRASYAIYDSGEHAVCWKRVAYDIDHFVTNVQETCEKDSLVQFLLKKIEAERQPPIREIIDFTPGKSAVNEEVEREREIEQIKAEATRWKRVASITAVVLFGALAMFYMFWRAQPLPQTIEGSTDARMKLEPLGQPVTRDYLAESGTTEGDVPAGWRVNLDDARQQSVTFGDHTVVLESGNREYAVELTFPLLRLIAVRRLEINLQGKRFSGFQGERPTFMIDYVRADGAVERSVVQEPLAMEEGLSKKYTISSIPEDVTGLIIHVRGRFAGRIRLDQLTLTAYPDDEKWLEIHGPVDINSARPEALQKIPGIGEKLALEIEKRRMVENGYGEISDLLNVSGIGPKTLEDIRGHLTVGEYEEYDNHPEVDFSDGSLNVEE